MKQVADFISLCILCTGITFLASCGRTETSKVTFSDTVQCVQTTVTYSVVDNEIKTNEYLEVVVSATTNDTSAIVFPDMIEAHSFIPAGRTVTRGKITGPKTVEFSCRYTLEPTVPGDFTIRSFNVKTVQGDTAHSVATQKIPVTILSLFEQGAAVDIMEVEPPVSDTNNLVLGTILVILLIIVIGTVYLIKRDDEFENRSPSKQAEYEIGRLNGTDQEFAHKLRSICIAYLEKEIDISFGAASNEEVIARLEELRIFNADIIALIAALLDGINVAKYSNEAMSAQELCSQALEFLSRSTVSLEVSKEFAGEEIV